MSLVQRYEQHANSHNFLSFRDRTIAYIENKKKKTKRFRHDGFFN